MLQAKWVHQFSDQVLQEFREFLDVAASSSAFANFDPKSDRLDVLLHETIAAQSGWRNLWDVIQILLVMSNGQASVERGFSVNKQVMVGNMKDDSIVAQRVVVDSIRVAGGLEKVTITKELQMSASSARQRYVAYLDDKRKEKESKSKADKRKSLADELQELKQKRKRPESDIKHLDQSADELAEKAEVTRNMTFIIKSNSLRHTAKNKRASLSDLDKDIEETLKKMDWTWVLSSNLKHQIKTMMFEC